ncbi:hypothetical protein [Nocardia otitidiscaviarum]|uniref:hypothetical protein n=1 Tax=Nocardia otitidiscaviarum TaxID=1823 RepID=UPI002454E98D|nr:hypothetical protein [Nocardia otitidiscaviarum]
MLHNIFRTKGALTASAAVPLVAIAVSGCGTATGEADPPADAQVEVLELGVENDQYASLDLGQPGVSVGDMDVYSGNAIQDGRRRRRRRGASPGG